MLCATLALWLLAEGIETDSRDSDRLCSKKYDRFDFVYLNFPGSNGLHDLHKRLLYHFMQPLTNTLCRYSGSSLQCSLYPLLFHHG